MPLQSNPPKIRASGWLRADAAGMAADGSGD